MLLSEAMNPTRRSLLLSGAAVSLVPGRALGNGTVAPGAPKNLIVVFADGGWDVTFSVDPKEPPPAGASEDVLHDWPVDGPWVDVPSDDERQAVINGIPLQLNDDKRKAVTDFFTQFGDRACVINGIWTGSIVHQPSRIRILTGTTRPDKPDFATIVGAERGISDRLPLGTIDFSGLGYTGDFAAQTGRIGYSSQLKSLLDRNESFGAPSWADYTLPLYRPTTDEEAAIQEHLMRRIASYRNEVGGIAHNDHLLDGMIESFERRADMMSYADNIVGDLILGERPTLSKQVGIAVDLLKNGVCHTVTIASELVWDTHDRNEIQHDKYQEFFTSLGLLAGSLDEEGLLDSTLVVVLSEMTRTPKRNVKTGKDHWPHTSQLWFGAGVKGGTVVGGTNDSLESMNVDLTTGVPFVGGVDDPLNKYDNVVAGLLEHMGIDHELYLPGVQPMTAATDR
jgi:hypothetical protein